MMCCEITTVFAGNLADIDIVDICGDVGVGLSVLGVDGWVLEEHIAVVGDDCFPPPSPPESLDEFGFLVEFVHGDSFDFVEEGDEL